MPKKRLDNLLAERELAETRSKAQALIIAGRVFVNGGKIEKPGTQVAEDCVIDVKETGGEYVSRGGVKLAHALDQFSVDPAGKICLDVGASTGGFTDCLLKRGAPKVWAIDVGTNQLHYSLRTDPRVVCLEKTNAREMDVSIITEAIDILVADVSFISLKLVIPPFLPVLSPGARLVLMAKPQFEAGREKVGKGGIVRDESVHLEVIENLKEFFKESGLEFDGLCPSPILGAAGNAEFFLNFGWSGL